MSSRIRIYDWESTPLGAIGSWPDRLKAAVEAVLSLPEPAIMGWGPELSTIYNDALIPYLGARHPDALGRAASLNWESIWPTAGPVIEQTLVTGKGASLPKVESSKGRERVFFLVMLNPLRSEDGTVTGVSAVACDVTEQTQVNQMLREKEERLRLALDVGQLAVFDVDLQADVHHWSEELYQLLGYGFGEVPEGREALLARVHPDDLPVIRAATEAAEKRKHLYTHEYRIVRPDGEVRWCRVDGRYIRGADGTPARLLGVVRDITEEQQFKVTQELLIAELQHRTRNLLAVVTATARQTRRTSASLDEFADKFEERLAALSRVQGLLSRHNAQPVLLRELVESELQAHGVGANGRRVKVRGPRVRLPSKALQALMLALHELATNAIKYGALSQEQARLSITWDLSTVDGQRVVTIRWSEEGVELPPTASTRRGFGRQLIEGALPYDLHATTHFGFAQDGVRCEIAIPL